MLRAHASVLTTVGLLIAAGTAATSIATSASANSPTTPLFKHSCATQPPAGHRTCFALRRTSGARTDPKRIQPDVVPAGYGPGELQSAYGLPSVIGGGTGQTVYIIDAYDSPTLESDLGVYRGHFDLGQCTTANGCFHKLNQLGAASPLPVVNNGWAGEEALDVEAVSASCPQCHITVIESTTDSDVDMKKAILTANNLGARIVSMSWGGPASTNEYSFDQTAWKPGVAYLASSGDASHIAQWPAVSPGVVAVGGTTLTHAANTRGWTEIAWGDNGGGAGSGCDKNEPKPAWQSGNSDVAFCTGRAEADISAVADPSTGLSVYNTTGDSGWGVYGGTSASAPLIAGMFGLAGGPGTGVVPQAALWTARPPASLNDVVSGGTTNCSHASLCKAGVGWDGPTGLGTPNGIGALTSSDATLTNPGPQTTVVGAQVNLTLNASVASGGVTFGATGLPNGLSINAVSGRITGAPTDAGAYPVTVSAATSGSTAYQSFTWTVSPMDAVTTVSGSQVYGGSPTFAATTTISGLTATGVTCTQLSSVGALTPTTPVGSYTIIGSSCSGGVTSQPTHYRPSPFVGSTFTVTPAPLTVTPTPVTVTYGNTGPSVQPSYSGFVNGEGPSLPALQVTPTCSVSASPADLPVGTYSNWTSCTSGSAPNYVLRYNRGSLNVVPAGLTVAVTGEVINNAAALFQGVASRPGVAVSGISCSTANGGIPIASLPDGSYLLDLASCTGATLSSANFTVTGYTGGQFGVAPFGVTAETLPVATVGKSYAGKLTASGGKPSYAFHLFSGQLPPGLQLSVAGTITGTPTASGTFTATVSVTDTSHIKQNRAWTFAIAVRPESITTATLPPPIIGRSYRGSVVATGGKGTITYAIAKGALPTGLKLATSGAVTGIPTGPAALAVIITATDSSTPKVTTQRTFVVVVDPIAVVTSAVTTGQVGKAYSGKVTATAGKATLIWSVIGGALPPGVHLSTAGVLSGTPTASGTYTATVQVADASTPKNIASATISIAIAPIHITTTALPGGTTGKTYSARLTATGGKTPLTWTVIAGQLPDGIKLSTAGAFTGAPTAEGGYTFTVQAKDANKPANTATATYTIVVN